MPERPDIVIARRLSKLDTTVRRLETMFPNPSWDQITGKPFLGTLFLHNDAADVSGYERLLGTPSGGSEDTDTAVVNSGTGEVLIDAYISYPVTGLGTAQILGGVWYFDTYRKVDITAGTTQIVFRVYKRSQAGVETELFNVTGAEINDTSATLAETEYIGSDYSLDPSDRLVVKYYAKTNSVPDVTVTLYYEGTTHYSHIHPPEISGAGGGVVGPGSATDGNFASFDGVSGSVIKDSTYAPSSFALAADGIAAHSGSSFPGSPSDGDLFFRTDLGWWCFYDSVSSNWLTVQEFRADREIVDTTTSPTNNYISPLPTDYAIFFTRITFGSLVTGTNDGSNYWSIDLRSYNGDYTSYTSIYSKNTSGDTVGYWVPLNVSPSSAEPTYYGRLLYVCTKTLSPGTLYVEVNVFYRLIVT